MRGEKDPHDVRKALFGPAEQLQAVFLRHLDVGQQHIDLAVYQNQLCFLGAARGIHRVKPQFLPPDAFFQAVHNSFLVIHDQDLHRCPPRSTAGSVR